MSKKSNSEIISSLLYILVGVLLVIFRDRTLEWAMTVAGALFLIFGVIDLFKRNWGSGAVSLIIGLSIIVFGWALTNVVILVLGILISVKGIVALIDALRQFRKNAVDIVFSVLTILVGLLLAFGNLLGIMILIAGVMLMFDGVLGIIGAFTKK